MGEGSEGDVKAPLGEADLQQAGPPKDVSSGFSLLKMMERRTCLPMDRQRKVVLPLPSLSLHWGGLARGSHMQSL